MILLLWLSLPAFAATDPVAREIGRIELSALIGEMVGPDQALRHGAQVARQKGISWETLTNHPRFRDKLARVDESNARSIKEIIGRIGFPKISEYGRYMASNVWLLVQHMDQDVAFQEKVLEKMAALLPRPGEVHKPDYALLYDRVQVNSGRLQLYGSQGHCVGKQWEPRAMEDPARVDERRAQMDLPPMKEYREMFKEACR